MRGKVLNLSWAIHDLRLKFILSNTYFQLHNALKESTSALVKDPQTEYKTWCQKWDLVSKDLGSMDIEAMDIKAMDMTSCSLVMKIEYS